MNLETSLSVERLADREDNLENALEALEALDMLEGIPWITAARHDTMTIQTDYVRCFIAPVLESLQGHICQLQAGRDECRHIRPDAGVPRDFGKARRQLA